MRETGKNEEEEEEEIVLGVEGVGVVSGAGGVDGWHIVHVLYDLGHC